MKYVNKHHYCHCDKCSPNFAKLNKRIVSEAIEKKEVKEQVKEYYCN